MSILLGACFSSVSPGFFFLSLGLNYEEISMAFIGFLLQRNSKESGFSEEVVGT